MPESTPSSDKRQHTLADGNTIPILGLGVWQVPTARSA